jgi:hypothetical protein
MLECRLVRTIKVSPAVRAAVIAEYKRGLSVLGGKARAAMLTTEERSKMGKVGGKARWKGMTKAQRRKHARKAAAARWGSKQGKD